MPSDSYTLIISEVGAVPTHASTHVLGGTDALSLNAAQITAGTLPVTRGGTGLGTFTAGIVKSTGGTSNLVTVAAPTGTLVGTTDIQTLSNKTFSNLDLGVPISGTLTSCSGLPLDTGTVGILPTNKGGTGLTTYNTGELLCGSGTALAVLAPGTSGKVLTSVGPGSTPVWSSVSSSAVDLSAASGVLPISKGGTNYGVTATGLTEFKTALGYTFGTISSQNSNAVSLTGGTIAGVAISGGTLIGAAVSGGTITGTAISGGTIVAPVISEVDTLSFDITPGSTILTPGQLRWNTVDKTLDLKISTDVTLQIGQETNIYAHNAESTTIANGKVVYIYSNEGTSPAVKLADNTLANATAVKVLGVATQDISSAQHGFITTQGLVRGVDVSTFGAAGTPLWLDAASGNLTATKPAYPASVVRVGIVVEPGVSGSFYVQPQLFSDGRVSGRFTWGSTNNTVGPTVTVSGLTSSSNVIIQERGTTDPNPRSYAVVCSLGSFVPHADANTGTAGKTFSYIAFID